MKSNMKRIGVGLIAVVLLALSACDKHTCPTYSKANVKHADVRA